MADRTAEDRGYPIGERNPRLIEDEWTETQRRRFWSRVKAWADRPGGKY